MFLMKTGVRSVLSYGVVLVLFIPLGVFLVKTWDVRWIGDDGLINTRVVENILDGFGPVYNLGERVEAFTSPLWIWILAVFGLLGFRPDSTSVYLGLVTSLIGMLLAVWGAMRMARRPGERRRYALPLGMLVYAVIPPAWDYGTSGLETGLGLAWLGGMYFFLASMVARDRQGDLGRAKKAMVYAALLGLGPLIRPEMSIFSIGLLIPMVVAVLEDGNADRRFGWKRIVGKAARLFGLMAVLPVAYQVFRMGYYAALTSNTAIAKEAFVANWVQGWWYFENFFIFYYLFIPLGILGVFFVEMVRRKDSWAMKTAILSPVVCGIAYTLAVVKVGGDFMHGRFFLPGLFGGLLPVSVVFVDAFNRSTLSRIAGGLLIAAMVGWSVYCGTSLRMTVGNQNLIGDERGWYTRRAVTSNPMTAEDYRRLGSYKEATAVRSALESACKENGAACGGYVLVDKPNYGNVVHHGNRIPLNPKAVHASEQVVVMRGGIGVFGVAAGSRIHVVDRFGLVDPIASRLKLGPLRGRPGHEKYFPNSWMVARFADAGAVEDNAVEIAAEALSCTPLSELIDAVTAPLTFNRFWTNVAASFQYQALRVSPSVVEARKTFCK